MRSKFQIDYKTQKPYVKQYLCNILYDLETSIDEAIKLLENKKKEYSKDWEGLFLETDNYYDSSSLKIYGRRKLTKEEMKEFQEEQQKNELSIKESRRKQYEELKKEFKD